MLVWAQFRRPAPFLQPHCLVPCLVPEALPAFTRELMLSFHGWGYASTAASPGKGKGKVREPASKTAVSFGTPNKGAIEEASQKEGKVRKQERQLRSK